MIQENKLTAIKVDKVSKSFKLPHQKSDSLKSGFVNLWRKTDKSVEVQHALSDISFDIKEGEFFGIVGRNGSGKSTLLKIIAGIYQPNSGSVTINGRLVPFIELGVGFNPELTGRENVFLNGALMGFSESEILDKYEAIVAFAELDRFMDQMLKNYSSGMQVRLAFSVATILAESEVLLIDEVLAVGDADFQRKCFAYFKKLKKDGKTVIFVSHDMSAIREYCDRAILIDKSKIVFSGTSDEVAKEYTKLFLPEVYKVEKNAELRAKAAAKAKKTGSKWGAGGIDIINLAISKSVLNTQKKDSVASLSFAVVSLGDFVGNIVPGFTIKNEKGQPVFGTNTDVLFQKRKKFTLSLKKQQIDFTWTFPNILNEGSYVVEPAVLSGENGETLQWWDEALTFKVINEQSTPYPVTPDIKVTTT